MKDLFARFLERSPFTVAEAASIITSFIILLAFVLPVGYLITQQLRISNSEFHHKSFSVFGAGTGIVIVLWTWIYMLGGTWATIEPVLITVATASTGYVIFDAWRRRAHARTVIRWKPLRVVPMFLLLGVVALFYLAPRTVDGEISQRQLMGPDSIGYSNAVSALLSRGSFFDLEGAAIEAAEVQNSAELLGNRQVYQIADKGLSVSAEFIVGAYRVGFPSIVATVTGLLKPDDLFSAMYVVAATYITFGALLIQGLMRSFGFSTVVGFIVALISAININLLVGVHEGGIAQGFMYSSLAAFLTASLSNSVDDRYRSMLYMFSMITAISSYIDMFFVYLALVVSWYCFAKARNDSNSQERIRTARRATLWSLLLMLPLSMRLPSFMVRRFADARQGGWGWDSWTELSGLLGLDDPYTSPPDSLIIQVFLVVIGIMGFSSLRQTPKTPAARSIHSFALGFVSIGFGFYLYSRYLMHHSTYQWFKLAGTMLGPSVVVIILLSVSGGILAQRSATRMLRVVLTVVGAIVVATSFSYINHYFENAKRLNPELVREILRPESAQLVEKFAFVGAFEWEELALTPFWSAEFLNSYDNDPRVNPNITRSRPVALIIRNDRCGEARCESAPESSRFKLGTFYTVIDLGLNSQVFKGEGQEMRLARVNQALKSLKLRELDKNWIDFRTMESNES